MNLLDLPLRVVLAGWLLRRLTKPAKFSNIDVATPEQLWRAERDAIKEIYTERSRCEIVRSPWLGLLDDVIHNYKMSQLEKVSKLDRLGISFVATIRKGKDDEK